MITSQSLVLSPGLPLGGVTDQCLKKSSDDNYDVEWGFYNATEIENTPSGGISSTTVQGAINELDSEKQNSLGFTPENVSNKQTDLTPSDTKYPTVNAVNTGLAEKMNIDAAVGRLLRTIIVTGVTYTSSPDCNRCFIRGQAGGGGGGGANTGLLSGSAGGGGSSGGYFEKLVSVSPSTEYTCSVGAAGTAGAAAGGTGGTGGNTTITIGATTYTAFGGLGGVGSAASLVGSAMGGSSPAISTNGDVNSGGMPGNPGVTLTGLLANSGNGGSCLFGVGGLGRNTQGPGNAGIGKGAGGSGGCSLNGGAAAAGGAGLTGIIVIDEYS